MRDGLDIIYEGMLEDFALKTANVVAGTIAGTFIGNKGLNIYLSNATPQELYWLSQNIDYDNNLRSEINNLTNNPNLQYIVGEILKQPNIKLLIKKWLNNKGY